MTPLLVLRPEPGLTRTIAAARKLDLDAIGAALFTITPLRWALPEPRSWDALLLSSAHAARRLAGRREIAHMPVYAVGQATAEAAKAAGLQPHHVGSRDADALLPRVAADGHQRVLHLCGRDYRQAGIEGLTIERHAVYAAEPVAVLPEQAAEALARNAVTLLHSPRAAAIFATLVDAAGFARAPLSLVAISARAAAAAGAGWRSLVHAAEPSDAAMLEIASRLCQNPAR